YRVRAPELKLLHAEAQPLIAALDYFAVEAVPRKLTRRADKLANAALDRRLAIRRRPSAKPPSPAAPAAGTRKFRAVYQGGVLKPLEELDLADGTEVELQIRRKP
ncbi:MAG: antitoxin AF2212-like protein, partial [Candidatus Acidoferrales bacterium]